MATGMLLELHLHALDHPQDHDCDQCPICRQLLVAPDKYDIQLGPQIKDLIEFQYYYCEPYFSVQSTPFHLEPFTPRPPPVLS